MDCTHATAAALTQLGCAPATPAAPGLSLPITVNSHQTCLFTQQVRMLCVCNTSWTNERGLRRDVRGESYIARLYEQCAD